MPGKFGRSQGFSSGSEQSRLTDVGNVSEGSGQVLPVVAGIAGRMASASAECAGRIQPDQAVTVYFLLTTRRYGKPDNSGFEAERWLRIPRGKCFT
jgi:hypothetical protein